MAKLTFGPGDDFRRRRQIRDRLYIVYFPMHFTSDFKAAEMTLNETIDV